LNFQEYTKILQ